MDHARRAFFKAVPSALALSALASLPLAACTGDGTTESFNTAELDKDAQAISYAAKTLLSMSAFTTHLTADQLTSVNGIFTKITQITSEISANSSGTITITVGKQWASALMTEFQELLTVAQPIVAEFDPSASDYITAAEALIPLLEVLGATITSSATVRAVPPTVRAARIKAAAVLTPQQRAQIRSRVYAVVATN